MTYAAKISNNDEFSSPKSREQMTKMLMRLFNEWALSTAEQLKLLGLRETSRNMLSRYRDLDSIIPYEQDKLDRASILLAIYKNLYDLYPENQSFRNTWVKKKNQLLNDQRPIDIMLDQGLFGLANVMRFLDRQMVM